MDQGTNTIKKVHKRECIANSSKQVSVEIHNDSQIEGTWYIKDGTLHNIDFVVNLNCSLLFHDCCGISACHVEFNL